MLEKDGKSMKKRQTGWMSQLKCDHHLAAHHLYLLRGITRTPGVKSVKPEPVLAEDPLVPETFNV